MKSLGYVNRYNRGIVRVQKELSENGNLQARFSVNNITVFGVNVNDATYTEDPQLRIDFTNQATNQADSALGQIVSSYSQATLAEYDTLYTQVAERFDSPEFNSLKSARTIKILNALLLEPQSKRELLVNILGLTVQVYNYQKFIEPLVVHNFIVQTIKAKPRSPKQKYAITLLGYFFLSYLNRASVK